MPIQSIKHLKMWCLVIGMLATGGGPELMAQTPCESCKDEQKLKFNLRGVASMAGTATVQIAYGPFVTNILMTGGVIQGPDGSGEYSVQSFACVQWDFDLPVEPKCDQPVSIQYLFIDDNENPGYTEFQQLEEELNPVIYWTRPSSKCLKVYFDESDGNWVLEPLVFLSYSTAPARMKGVIETDDSKAGDSRGPTSGGQSPQPDISELTNAPPVGDLTADCPGQGGGGFSLAAKSLSSPTGGKKGEKTERSASKGLRVRPARWEFNSQNVTTSEAKEPKGKSQAQDRQKSLATVPGAGGTLSLLSANGYSVAKPIGQLRWEMSLGSVGRTLRLGRLIYQAETLDSTAYSRERLTLAAGGDPNMVINDTNGFLRQVELPDNLIDIVGLTNGFQVGVYSKAQVDPFDPMTGLFPTNGLPLLTWKVENPDATPLGRIRFTKSEGTNSEVHLAEWSGTAQVSGTMTITRHGGKWKDVTEYSLASTNQRIETVSLYQGTNLQHKVRQVYQEFYNWGAPGDIYDAVVERVEDPDGQALTSSFVYWDQTSQPGNLLYSATYPDGYTELVPNRISGDGYAPVISSGSPVRVDQPYRDFNAGSASGRTTQTFFDEVSSLQLWVIEQTTVGGEVVGYRETLNDFTLGGHWVTATFDYTGDGSYIYSERIVSLSTRRTVRSQDRQGNVRNYLYTPGFWNPVLESFSETSGTEIPVIKSTVVNGVVDAEEGIANKTTVDVTIVDNLGRLLAQESYASAGDWENTTALIDRTVHSYADGQLTATKRNGRLTYKAAYFDDGMLAWEEDESGRRTEYEYDEMDRVSQRILRGRGGDADQVITYEYDVMGRVIKETRSAGSFVVETRSVYNLAGELVVSWGSDGLTNIVNADYTSGFKVVTENPPTLVPRTTSFYKDRQVRSVTGNGIEDEYHLPFLALWTPSSYREALAIYRNSALTELKETKVLDWLGSELLVQTPGFQGIGNRTRYTFYDVAVDGSTRQRVTKTEETGRASRLFLYDELGQLAAQGLDLNTNGVLDAVSVDPITVFDQGFTNIGGILHHIARSYRYLQDNVGTSNLIEITRTPVAASLPTNVIATNIVERIGAGMAISAVTLDSATGELTKTDQEAGRVHISLERDGRLRSELRPGVPAPRTYTYTPLGELETLFDPITGGITNQYDPVSRRLTSVRDPLGRETTYDYYPSGTTNAGQLKGVRNAENQWTYFEYDLAGRIHRKWGVNTYPIEYDYDDDGRMTQLKTFQTLPGTVDWSQSTWPNPPGGNITQWVYDEPSGLLERKVHASGTAGATAVVFTYDSGHFVDTRTSGRGHVADYGFDSAGRLRTVTYSDGSAPLTFEYDRAGRVSSVNDAAGSRSFQWTADDEITNEVFTSGVLAGFAVSRAYDTNARLDRVELQNSGTTLKRQRFAYDAISALDYVADEAPDGSNVLRQYDYTPKAGTPFLESVVYQSGSLVMTQKYSRDVLGRLTGTEVALNTGLIPFAAGYEFTNRNRRAVANLGDTTKWQFEYNARGEVTSGKKKLSDGMFVGGHQLEYSYDDIGNRVITQFGGDAAGANTTQSAYGTANSFNQLTTRTVSGAIWLSGNAPESLTLQGAVDGQAFSVQRQSDDRFFAKAIVNNSASPLFSRVTIAGKSETNLIDAVSGYRYTPRNPEQFVHDADGNLVSNGRWTNTWNCENRLVAMEAKSDVPIDARMRLEFGYDYQGRRFSKRVYSWNPTLLVYELSAETRFLYDGWNLVAEVGSSNQLVRSYTWGQDVSGTIDGAGGAGGLLACTVHNGPLSGSYFFGYDGNGNVMALVNATNSNVVAEYEYGPFGEVLRSTGLFAKSNPWRFSTKYSDSETELLYYGYRYYDVSTGRWLSRDPIGEEGGLNLYGFVENDPISSVDAYGLFDFQRHVQMTGMAYSRVKDRCRPCECDSARFFEMLVQGALSPDHELGIGISAGIADSWATDLYLMHDFISAEYLPDQIKRGIGDFFSTVGGWLVPDDIQNWWQNDNLILGTGLELGNKYYPNGWPGRLYQSHYGVNSWQHAMSTTGQSASQVQQKLVDGSLLQIRIFRAAAKLGECEIAGYSLGRAVHFLQDSYSESHTLRAGGGIAMFQNYGKQSAHEHSLADATAIGGDVFGNAVGATSSFLCMANNRKLTNDDLRRHLQNVFYPITPGARADVTLPQYAKKPTRIPKLKLF